MSTIENINRGDLQLEKLSEITIFLAPKIIKIKSLILKKIIQTRSMSIKENIECKKHSNPINDFVTVLLVKKTSMHFSK